MSKLFQDSKVIFFDMGNTLIDFHKGKSDIEKDNIGINAVARFLSEKSNQDVTSEFVKREFVDKWFAMMPLRKKLHTEFSIEEFLNPLLNHLGLVFSEKEKINLMILFDSGYQQELIIEKNLQHTLSTLQKNFRIGVISNSPSYPEVNINHFEYLQISQYIEQYIFSYSLKVAKPQVEIFKKAIDLFKVNPERCIMVGDSLIADIGGAKQLNMKTIWLNSNNAKNTTEFFPDFEIKTINELIGLTCQ